MSKFQSIMNLNKKIFKKRKKLKIIQRSIKSRIQKNRDNYKNKNCKKKSKNQKDFENKMNNFKE